jgi:hypothetical protein
MKKGLLFAFLTMGFSPVFAHICDTKILKTMSCLIEDARNNTFLEIKIVRSITNGGQINSCSRDPELIVGYLHYSRIPGGAPTSVRVLAGDQHFDPLTRIERGQSFHLTVQNAEIEKFFNGIFIINSNGRNVSAQATVTGITSDLDGGGASVSVNLTGSGSCQIIDNDSGL